MHEPAWHLSRHHYFVFDEFDRIENEKNQNKHIVTKHITFYDFDGPYALKIRAYPNVGIFFNVVDGNNKVMSTFELDYDYYEVEDMIEFLKAVQKDMVE